MNKQEQMENLDLQLAEKMNILDRFYNVFKQFENKFAKEQLLKLIEEVSDLRNKYKFIMCDQS